MVDLLRAILEECAAVAARLGIELPVSLERRLEAGIAVGDHKTSMLQDLEAGKPLELDCLTGAVIELAAKLDVPAPHTHRRYLREASRRAGWASRRLTVSRARNGQVRPTLLRLRRRLIERVGRLQDELLAPWRPGELHADRDLELVEADTHSTSRQTYEILRHRVAHHELAELELVTQVDHPLLADRQRGACCDGREQEVDLAEQAREPGAEALAIGRGRQIVGELDAARVLEPASHVLPVLVKPSGNSPACVCVNSASARWMTPNVWYASSASGNWTSTGSAPRFVTARTLASNASRISGASGTRWRSGQSPTRMPSRPASRLLAGSPTDMSSVDESRGSAPATTLRRSAASAGVRAIGPGWSSERASGKTPAVLIRP